MGRVSGKVGAESCPGEKLPNALGQVESADPVEPEGRPAVAHLGNAAVLGSGLESVDHDP